MLLLQMLLQPLFFLLPVQAAESITTRNAFLFDIMILSVGLSAAPSSPTPAHTPISLL